MSRRPLPRWARRSLRWTAGLLAACIVALLLGAYVPLGGPGLAYHPLPAMTFRETVAAIRQRIRDAPPEIRPQCRGRMLQHGRRTTRVFVLMHGLSNCPAQFGRFGELLYRGGHNVLILRLPYHGRQDRLTEEWKLLSAQQMLDAANNAVDAARAMGEHVTVVGLSINATVAAWLAQHRADVDLAVLLAPFLAPRGVPGAVLAPLSRLIYRLPNRFLWWDPVRKEAAGGENAYPRFPTHAIAQVLRLSSEALAAAEKTGPRCGRVLLVTTAADQTVNNELTSALLDRWERRAPGRVRRYQFPASDGVGHDFIDPTQPYQKVEMVYPRLLDLMEAR